MAALYLFTLDLRLADNPGLHAANKVYGEVIPAFIYDSSLKWAEGGASLWWLHHSLADLQTRIRDQGGTLLLKQGDYLKSVETILENNNISAIYFSRAYEPELIAIQSKIYQLAEKNGLECKRYGGRLLWEPDAVFNKQGEPYKVFTPFYRYVKSQYTVPSELPKYKINWSTKKLSSDKLGSWKLLPQNPNWAKEFEEQWQPTELFANQTLAQMCRYKKFQEYSDKRDIPAEDGTSQLSPFLHFGQLSPRTVWHKISDKNKDNISEVEPFLRQLVWREFSYCLLFHWPNLPEKPFMEKFKDFPWRTSKKHLKAWQQGKTGYPIVDAGMRQLWQIGWMHNRVRMICASFLTKHLRIHWGEGAAWFWDTLVDADLANNSAGWQWVAGCGADAAPYFRVFNPTLQGEKFDKNGEYIKQWVPELAALPTKYIHTPWQAPQKILDEANIELGKTYPKPIVDHKTAREEALAAYGEIK